MVKGVLLNATFVPQLSVTFTEINASIGNGPVPVEVKVGFEENGLSKVPADAGVTDHS